MSMIYPSILIAAIVAVIIANLLAEALGRYGFPLPPNARRIGCIDGLRGFLALSVMVSHFTIWISVSRFGGPWMSPPVNFFRELGAGGVTLFFMTTGLVFYPTILAGMRSTAWLDLYIRRIFRIMPLVICSVFVVTLMIMIRTGFTPNVLTIKPILIWVSAWDEPAILDYFYSGRINAYVLWSLYYEWLFYIFMLPVCAKAIDVIRRHGLATWLLPAFILCIAVIARIILYLLGLYPGSFRFLPLFPIGMLAYELQSRPGIRAALSQPPAGLIAIGALLTGMIIFPDPYTKALPLFVIFFTCIACGNSLGGLLTRRSALILGECSFSIYILHGIVLDIMFTDARDYMRYFTTSYLPITLIIAMSVVVLLTLGTYLWIERPAINTGRAIVRWRARRVQAIAP